MEPKPLETHTSLEVVQNELEFKEKSLYHGAKTQS